MTARVDHEAIVVGAGPSGRFLASELARQGIDVLLVERRSAPAEPGVVPPQGGRAIGLHPPALAALEPSGATELLLALAARVERGLAYDGPRRLAVLDFARPGRRFPFAVSVPQSATEHAVSLDAPEPSFDAEVRSVVPYPDRVVLEIVRNEQEQELTARAVVLATGAAGRVLALPYARLAAREYPDRFLMSDSAEAFDRRGDDRTAVIALDPRGVLESFPLAGGGRRFVAGFGAEPDDVGGASLEDSGNGRSGHAARASERLRRAVAERSGDAASVPAFEAVSVFRIRRALLDRMRLDAGGRLFAIGDAAHEISPIGGQGMNLGLLDAAGLAPILAARLRLDDDQDRELVRWERQRLASARTAARIAGLNTALGRPRGRLEHTALRASIGTTMRTPLIRTAAKAYTMGFDRAA
ncbi:MULTISPECIES: FAD-dependent oxidoreductase [unclassified Leucobacter]|uniref:FAD-dependent oxidoreductase n=1 Tax=unclassified Leucobacter TaxID=2621730 RepID=UPI0006221BC6|nr:NAD(P)/FAD-dependent oxidoreductase [Leucobacter sp. Ag1]KKI16514.1 hypothetical protein XM48_15205 [Leucobacter sp. Ag1]